MKKRHADGIDLLVNNACISKRGLISGCTFDDFNRVLKIGVSAPYFLTKLFMTSFKTNAAIVNIASSRAFMSQQDTESYTAAKGGILALTHAMAVSLSGHVRVNSISPGWIDTGTYYDETYQPHYTPSDIAQHPSGRVGTPEDIARAVLFLADEHNTLINGGMTKQMIYHNDHGWELGYKLGADKQRRRAMISAPQREKSNVGLVFFRVFGSFSGSISQHVAPCRCNFNLEIMKTAVYPTA